MKTFDSFRPRSGQAGRAFESVSLNGNWSSCWKSTMKKHSKRDWKKTSGSRRIIRSIRKCSRFGVALDSRVHAFGESRNPEVLFFF